MLARSSGSIKKYEHPFRLVSQVYKYLESFGDNIPGSEAMLGKI